MVVEVLTEIVAVVVKDIRGDSGGGVCSYMVVAVVVENIKDLVTVVVMAVTEMVSVVLGDIREVVAVVVLDITEVVAVVMLSV
jgi:hypothetical protein